MEMRDRAAQFAPYAALVGFGDVVNEMARITEERVFRDEDEAEKINRTLGYILAYAGDVRAEFTYFAKDERKSGGSYIKRIGFAVKIDEENRLLIFSDKTFLPIDDIVDIELI